MKTIYFKNVPSSIEYDEVTRKYNLTKAIHELCDFCKKRLNNILQFGSVLEELSSWCTEGPLSIHRDKCGNEYVISELIMTKCGKTVFCTKEVAAYVLSLIRGKDMFPKDEDDILLKLIDFERSMTVNRKQLYIFFYTRKELITMSGDQLFELKE